MILPAYREQILDFQPESLRESLSIGKYYWILGWNPLSNPYNQGAFYCIFQENPVICACEQEHITEFPRHYNETFHLSSNTVIRTALELYKQREFCLKYSHRYSSKKLYLSRGKWQKYSHPYRHRTVQATGIQKKSKRKRMPQVSQITF